MIFKRKATDQLLIWKENYSRHYAAMLEGPRRVGKSTIAENFAKDHFRSYIIVDFANITDELLSVFTNIADLDFFFLRLQTVTNVTLYEHESVIIFDEIQLAPKVRQAIKYLVADGRYFYIETGSLLSIKKNVKGIVIPSEEHKIEVYPMDYEEFLWATGGKPDLLRQLSARKEPVGNAVNVKLMRDFRIYMAVGGMPQAVEAYLEKNNLEAVDFVKRKIIELYKDDFSKIDTSGKTAMLYDGIPSQLASNAHKFSIVKATKKKRTGKDTERLAELLNSKTVLICRNTSQPDPALSQTIDPDMYKLYYADTGLFVTQLFNDASQANTDIYKKLLSDNLRSNLGYLYENAAAQIIAASGRKLYYHTWTETGNIHPYEVDFLVTAQKKVAPIEVKSSSVRNHTSIDRFCQRYSSVTDKGLLVSQKDVGHIQNIKLRPIYMLPFILESM